MFCFVCVCVCVDRFPGHPETIDCLLPLDQDSILTGSSDGLIRVLSIHPNKVGQVRAGCVYRPRCIHTSMCVAVICTVCRWNSSC